MVICLNVLGSCYGTCGPTSANPLTGGAYSGDFPLANLTVLAQKLHDALAPAGMFIYTVSDRVEWLVAAYLELAWVLPAC